MSEAERDAISVTTGKRPPVPAQRHADPARAGVPQLPPRVIRRSRLIQRLGGGPSLVVLRAPTGFGKTVAAAQWLGDPAGPPGPAAWLRVGSDLDQTTFWTELADLLEETGLTIRHGGGPTNRAIEAALRRASEPTTVVVDGFDELSDSTVEHQLIDMARSCPHLRLVVCLRSAQHFPASIRVGITAALIGPDELAFTAEEIREIVPASVLPAHGIDDWADHIRQSTGGWPELTRALLLALQEDPRLSIDAAALDVAHEFVVGRVLSTLRHDEWIPFVLATSLAEALTERAAEQASGDPGAGHRLTRLELSGLLTSSLRGGRRVYRWPDAARRALQAEFRRREPRRAMALHAQLATHYIQEQEPRAALTHALQANNTGLLVRLVEEFWGRFIHDDQAALDTALAAVPLELLLKSPDAAAARDVRMHTRGEVVDDALLTLPDPLPASAEQLTRLARSDQAKAALRTASSVMIAMRLRGVADRALDYADRADTIGKVAAVSQWLDVGPALPAARLQIGITRLIFDRLAAAAKDFHQAHHAGTSETRGYVRRDSAGKLALLHALQGDTAEAERWLDRHRNAPARTGALTQSIAHSALVATALLSIDRLDSDKVAHVLPLIERGYSTRRNWEPFVSYAHARQALVWGDRAGAIRQLEEESQQFAAWLGPDWTITPLLTAIHVDLLLSLGHGGRARALLHRSSPHPALLPSAARLALLSGDTETALQLAGVRHRTHGPGVRAELLLIGAIARFRQGESRVAADLLTQALRVTQASRALLPFIMVPGDDLRQLAELVPEVHAALNSDALRAAGTPFPATIALIELTDRERTILDGIADGRTLQEIASNAYVSYNTIKTQARGLYAKLGANSRPSALTKATEHGLLTAGPDGSRRPPVPIRMLTELGTR